MASLSCLIVQASIEIIVNPGKHLFERNYAKWKYIPGTGLIYGFPGYVNIISCVGNNLIALMPIYLGIVLVI